MSNEQLSEKPLTLDIRKFRQIIGKNIISIIIWGFALLVIAFATATFVMTPKYESSVDILVNQKSRDIQTQLNIQQADLQAINTYKDVLKKPIILNDTLKQLQKKDNYGGSLEDLQNSLNITNETNSQVITVTATADNPYIARDIANTVGKVFTQKIKKIMQVNNVTIVSSAQVDTRPVSPNKKLLMILGLVVGLALGTVINLVKELMNTTVDDVSYLTETLALTNLGSIYHIDNGKRALRVVSVVEKNGNKKHQQRV